MIEKSITVSVGLLSVVLIIFLPLALMCVNWNTGEKVYTGYIYSATTDLGVTKGHLRFSEMAGEDKQPSFCVKNEDKQMLTDLAGSGKKVRVTETAGFKFAWPWQCAFPATIEILEDK